MELQDSEGEHLLIYLLKSFWSLTKLQNSKGNSLKKRIRILFWNLMKLQDSKGIMYLYQG